MKRLLLNLCVVAAALLLTACQSLPQGPAAAPPAAFSAGVRSFLANQ